VLERAAEPGGKMRQLAVGGRGVDAGPTVFTMRWIFDGLFASAGRQARGAVAAARGRRACAARLAPGWRAGPVYASTERSAAGHRGLLGSRQCRGYRDFLRPQCGIYATLREPYIASPRPGMLELVRRVGFTRLDAMWRTAPFSTLWSALGQHFRSAPAPAVRALCHLRGLIAPEGTGDLMLIAHVEQDGVWLVEGGMRAVALALQELAEGHGASFEFDCGVTRLLIENNRAVGVETAAGETLRADHVVFNGDVSALGTGLLGESARAAEAFVPAANRALSAITFCIVGRVSGLSLHYHNVFFAENYPEEFAAIFGRGEITGTPTVYVCAQDRIGGATPEGPERLLLLINAPADGDRTVRDEHTRIAYRDLALSLLRECGCEISFAPEDCVITDPAGFAERFPGSGGSLYGRANHGPLASFARPGARSKVPGLYLAGGSVHPGAGVPMSAMSGRLAAAAVLEDSI
jgi:1-hydroxycarotenoid 3,4-desaturase